MRMADAARKEDVKASQREGIFPSSPRSSSLDRREVRLRLSKAPVQLSLGAMRKHVTRLVANTYYV